MCMNVAAPGHDVREQVGDAIDDRHGSFLSYCWSIQLA
ncbi:hypothetical protein X769_33090 [Mesorhizobium sp. LSJC268A00]|nr:hypothetical protein X769_33090 [Mesorhizobium sp. LSJC268A00]